MSCSTCKGALEASPSSEMYQRCTACGALFMNMNGALTPYPVDASMRAMIEQSLGFAPSGAPAPAAPLQVPTTCPSCQGGLERSDHEGATFTRCAKCGMLSRAVGHGGLQAVVVTPPGGGWNAEFQAIFETKLGFSKRVRKLPPGVPT
jgi:uncharacterized C2H2 Zn-finger protein